MEGLGTKPPAGSRAEPLVRVRGQSPPKILNDANKKSANSRLK